MNKSVYKELEIAVVLLNENDIIATSGDGENFGSAMSEWKSFIEGGYEQ